MQKYLAVFVLASGFCSFAFGAAESLRLPVESSSKSSAFEFGNNVSQTTHVLPQGHASAGFQVAAVGLTDEVSVATSPWLWTSYNMQNIFLRHRFFDSSEQSLAWQGAYFQTYQRSDLVGGYQMRANWLSGIWSIKESANFTLHLNGTFATYQDDTNPFSLRRPTATAATDLNLSALFEARLDRGLFLLGELGVLGANQTLPQIHTGASLDYRGPNWLVKLGYSVTGTFAAFTNPSQRRDMAFNHRDGNRQIDPVSFEVEDSQTQSKADKEGLKYDFSMHPEMTFQYFF